MEDITVLVDGGNEILSWEITLDEEEIITRDTATAEDVGYCSEPDPNIIPYYEPPIDGKETNIIGAELTTLYNVFTSSNPNITSDLVFIIDDGITVLIEVTVMSGEEAVALDLLTNTYGMTGILPNG